MENYLGDGDNSRRWVPLTIDFLLSESRLRSVRLLLILGLWILIIATCIISTVWITPSKFMLIESSTNSTSLFFFFYPPLILGTLLLFWLGFEWGFIPLFLSAFFITFNTGITYYWGLLFGIAFVLGLGIYAITYYCVTFDPALRDLRSFVFFTVISFFAALGSSLGSFVWSDFFGLEAYKTTLLWKGWWTGMFLQCMLIIAPLLYLLTPAVYRLREKYFPNPPRPRVSMVWIYSAIASVAVILLVFIIAAKVMGSQALTNQLASLHPGAGRDLAQTSESLQIISWISIGLVLSLGTGGIYLVGSWNKRLLQEVNKKTYLLQENKEQLKEALDERDLFLDTIHDRIKNNLTMVLALLELQLKNVVDKPIAEILKDSHSRIRCLALIHETMDHSDSFREVNIKNYAVKLSNRLQKAFQNNEQDIDVSLNVQDITIDIDDAVPVAMIMNELMVNAYIHGFRKRSQGVIFVEFLEIAGELVLRVRNNGNPLPPDFESITHHTLGFKLIRTLVKQLKGEFTIEDREKPSFSINIPMNIMVEA